MNYIGEVVPEMEFCFTCNGDGMVDGLRGKIVCPMCEGIGTPPNYYRERQGGEETEYECRGV